MALAIAGGKGLHRGNRLPTPPDRNAPGRRALLGRAPPVSHGMAVASDSRERRLAMKARTKLKAGKILLTQIIR
jgi:hypothetical protein